MSERCACGAFELDKVPSRQHGRSCNPGASSSDYDRPCPVDWCRLLDGHGGLHLAIPEVAALRADLAKAREEVERLRARADRLEDIVHRFVNGCEVAGSITVAVSAKQILFDARRVLGEDGKEEG